MFAKSPVKPRFASAKRQSHEPVVGSNLAYDLSDLDYLRRQGKPISPANVEGMYYDGETNVSADLPLDRMRGVDINDMWNAAQDAQKRLTKAGIRKVDLSNQNQ